MEWKVKPECGRRHFNTYVYVCLDAYPEYIKNSYKSVGKKKRQDYTIGKMGKEFEKALHTRDLSKWPTNMSMC